MWRTVRVCADGGEEALWGRRVGRWGVVFFWFADCELSLAVQKKKHRLPSLFACSLGASPPSGGEEGLSSHIFLSPPQRTCASPPQVERACFLPPWFSHPPSLFRCLQALPSGGGEGLFGSHPTVFNPLLVCVNHTSREAFSLREKGLFFVRACFLSHPLPSFSTLTRAGWAARSSTAAPHPPPRWRGAAGCPGACRQCTRGWRRSRVQQSREPRPRAADRRPSPRPP